jgi:hypothetical protein
MLTCPLCKKTLEPATTPCPRCRADLTLLVDFMGNLDEQLKKADEALKAGELGDAVWAYLNVLETDPEHAVARRQVNRVATAVRQFDEAKRRGRQQWLMIGAGAAVAGVLALAGVFYLGFYLGKGL